MYCYTEAKCYNIMIASTVHIHCRRPITIKKQLKHN